MKGVAESQHPGRLVDGDPTLPDQAFRRAETQVPEELLGRQTGDPKKLPAEIPLAHAGVARHVAHGPLSGEVAMELLDHTVDAFRMRRPRAEPLPARHPSIEELGEGGRCMQALEQAFRSEAGEDPGHLGLLAALLRNLKQLAERQPGRSGEAELAPPEIPRLRDAAVAQQLFPREDEKRVSFHDHGRAAAKADLALAPFRADRNQAGAAVRAKSFRCAGGSVAAHVVAGIAVDLPHHVESQTGEVRGTVREREGVSIHDCPMISFPAQGTSAMAETFMFWAVPSIAISIGILYKC